MKRAGRKNLTDLYKAILTLKTTKECRRFFRDLCTMDELNKMVERWQVVQLVSQDVDYRTIALKTGASTTTVARVAHWLHHGTGGYKLMLHRLR